MELRRVAFAALLLGGALLLGTSCDDNSTTSVHVRRCTIVVETFPVQLAAPWRLTSPDSALQAGSGSIVLEDMRTGQYTLEWLPLAGWTPPLENPRIRFVDDGETGYFTGTYTSGSQLGTLIVDAAPDYLDAPWSVTLPSGATASGSGDATLPDLPPGTYTITWGAVADWNAPHPNPVAGELMVGDSLTFTGAYSYALPTGTIAIDPDPDYIDAPWSLSGPGGYTAEGQGDQTLDGVPLGEYELTWGDVEYYFPPAENPAAGALDELTPLVFSGEYQPTGEGDHIGIYADSLGAVTSVVIEPNVVTTLYIVAHLPSLGDLRLQAVDFAVPAWFDPGSLGITDLQWRTDLLVGNIRDGITMAFEGDGPVTDALDNIVLGSARVVSLDASWPAPNTRITVQGSEQDLPLVVDENSLERLVLGDSLLVNPLLRLP